MQGTDLLIAGATVLGPILAVQAQKWVERAREYRSRKSLVFSTLMATRLARLHLDHVRALNMIEMAFYGRHPLGLFRWQTKSESAVVDAWYRYLDNLERELKVTDQSDWEARNDLFIDLLAVMAVDVGLRFDRRQLKKSVYSPIAHSETERDETELRKRLISFYRGEASVKMDVTSFPVDPGALAAQVELHKRVAAAFGDGALAVEVKDRTAGQA